MAQAERNFSEEARLAFAYQRNGFFPPSAETVVFVKGGNSQQFRELEAEFIVFFIA